MTTMCTIPAQKHTHLTTPHFLIGSFWSAPGTVYSLSHPVFPVVWVFPAKASAKDIYFLRCIYILKVELLSRKIEGNDPECI